MCRRYVSRATTRFWRFIGCSWSASPTTSEVSTLAAHSSPPSNTRLADALEAADPGQGWHDWRNADGHPHRVQAVRAHLTGAGGWWHDANGEQRAAYVRDILAPLRSSPELLAELTTISSDRRLGD